jgi:hypothetical protein
MFSYKFLCGCAKIHIRDFSHSIHNKKKNQELEKGIQRWDLIRILNFVTSDGFILFMKEAGGCTSELETINFLTCYK